jgi:hypothetical protein
LRHGGVIQGNSSIAPLQEKGACDPFNLGHTRSWTGGMWRAKYEGGSEPDKKTRDQLVGNNIQMVLLRGLPLVSETVLLFNSTSEASAIRR